MINSSSWQYFDIFVEWSGLICFNIVDLNTVRGLGVVYFLFLFFFSGLEFTLTFLTHKNFKYSRYVCTKNKRSIYWKLHNWTLFYNMKPLIRCSLIMTAPGRGHVASPHVCRLCNMIWTYLFFSMQQGMMFFFIGITMAIVQGITFKFNIL